MLAFRSLAFWKDINGEKLPVLSLSLFPSQFTITTFHSSFRGGMQMIKYKLLSLLPQSAESMFWWSKISFLFPGWNNRYAAVNSTSFIYLKNIRIILLFSSTEVCIITDAFY